MKKIQEFFKKISTATEPFFKKAAAICKTVFGYAILIVLFAGGITSIGYLAALIIGGDIATEICNVIYKRIFPVIIYATSITVLFGLFSMYLGGELALTVGKKKNKTEKEKQ